MNSSYSVKVILDHYPYLEPQRVIDRLRYSTFVSLPKRYMYFEVPKAACTAMKWLLHRLENGGAVEWGAGETRRRMFIHVRKNVPLPSLVDLDDSEQRQVLESADFLRMTIVRNPYARLISTWRNKVMLCEPGFQHIYLDLKGALPEPDSKPAISFEEFVQYLASSCDVRTCNPHWRRQTDHTFFTALNFSWVGKLESLDETVRRFQLHLRRSEPLALLERNASVGFGHVSHDARVAGLISNLYRPDFERLGYDAELWPIPEQREGIEVCGKSTVSEDLFREEVIERNMIISQLWSECARLQRLAYDRGQPGRRPVITDIAPV